MKSYFFDCEDQPFVLESGLAEQMQNELVLERQEEELLPFLDQYYAK